MPGQVTEYSALGSTIETSEIANDAVTYAKIQNVSATDRLLGRSTAGAGDIEEIVCTSFGRAILDDASVAAQRSTLGLAIGTDVQAFNDRLADIAGATFAQGNVLYYNGTNIVVLAPGTSGNFLKTNGAGANPEWASASASFPLLASPGGTASAPAYSFSGDANTGIYSDTADHISFTTAGVQRWKLDSNGDLQAGADNQYDLGTGSLKFRRIRAGTSMLTADGNASECGFGFSGDSGTGWFRSSGMQMSVSGTVREHNTTSDHIMTEARILSWGSSGISTPDCSFARTTTNTIGANAGGATTTRGGVSACLCARTTAVGNVGTGEDVLQTYTLPASAFSTNGQVIEIWARGTFANNGNTKTLKLEWGSQEVLTYSLDTFLSGKWCIHAIVVRTGTNTQDVYATLFASGGAGSADFDQEITAGTQTETSTIVIQCTGEATSDNDIVQESLLVIFHNAANTFS
jgi:hypothetical protein